MAESADKTTANPPQFITDASGNFWSLTPSANHGMVIDCNGVVDISTAQAALLYYLNHEVYQKNTAGSWWVWRSSAWVSTTDPTVVTPPTPTPPTSQESAEGTAVTTVGPKITNSVGEAWTLANTGSQPMQVAVNGVPDTTTAAVVMLYYSAHKVYQSNSAGGWWSKTRASDTWTQTTDPRPAPPSTGKTPPPQASSAGYSRLVFEDDFTTSNTIATSQNAGSGFAWYWAQRYGKPASPTEWTVNTTIKASGITNGNNGGGPNASAAGGVLTLKTGGFPNANLISLPGWAMNNGSVKLPPMGTGHWQRCYMEAYIQYVPDQNQSVNYTQTGWPAYWSWAAEGLADYGFPGSGLHVANCIEVDFLEQFGHALWDNGSGNPLGQWSAGLINHGGGGGAGLGGGSIDSNWHTYGFLWTTGHISIYFDNVQKGNITLSSGATGLDQQSLFLTLGTGPNWAMNIDWVRVWQ